jgi:hypothetical protein
MGPNASNTRIGSDSGKRFVETRGYRYDVVLDGWPVDPAHPVYRRSAERQIFLDLVAASKPEAFRPSDSPLLCAYARAVVLERQSAAELAAGNTKALARWSAATKALVALSARLRLCPQSRQPNNPGRPGGKPIRPLSVYERMNLEESGEDGTA